MTHCFIAISPDGVRIGVYATDPDIAAMTAASVFGCAVAGVVTRYVKTILGGRYEWLTEQRKTGKRQRHRRRSSAFAPASV